MIKKKYLLLGGLFATLAAGPAFAQESGNTSSASYGSRDMTYRGESYDVLDTSYVPSGRMEQHRKFLNHQTNFPAKPRNMWEVGVNVGMLKCFWRRPEPDGMERRRLGGRRPRAQSIGLHGFPSS
jgi:hypothetical protein